MTTTVNIPRLLRAYASDARDYSRAVFFVCVGDKRTPQEAYDFCQSLEQEFSLRVKCFDVNEQEIYLRGFKGLGEHLPWDCVQRRNVGLLYAYEQGADIIVTIDDDNVLSTADFFGFHGRTGMKHVMSTISMPSGWFNVCDALEEKSGMAFYHRGHPFGARWTEHEPPRRREKEVHVVANAGLWLEDPDLDAFARLAFPIRATRMKPEYEPTFVLDRFTWAPFNSQNTALERQMVPSYFLSPYLQRFDDIFASYVVRHVADHLGDYVAYGYPLVRQVRNPHSILADFDQERFGYETVDRFCQLLRECHLTEKSYLGCAKEIAAWMKGTLLRNEGWTERQRLVFEKYSEGYRLWVNSFSSS